MDSSDEFDAEEPPARQIEEGSRVKTPGACLTTFRRGGPEIELYKIFCKAIEEGKICPGYKCIPCDTKYDMDDPGKNKLFRLMDEMAKKKLPEPFDYIREAFVSRSRGSGLDTSSQSKTKRRGRVTFWLGRPMVRSLIWSVAEHVVLLQSTSRRDIRAPEDQWRYVSDLPVEEQKMHEDTWKRRKMTMRWMAMRRMTMRRTNMWEATEDDNEIDEDVEERRTMTIHCVLASSIWRATFLTLKQVTETRSVWKTMPERLRKGSSSMDSSGDKRHPPSTLAHYRLVEMEVGKPLSEFETSLELVKLVSDCLIAHEDAVTRARVLHRDISSGNMLMYPFKVTSNEGVPEYLWTGLLNDWELSKPIAMPGTTDSPRRDGRTGTWQFMSSAILDDKSRRPMIEDELESFFYVLLYYAVRYLKHNSKDVASFMLAFFDSYSFTNGEYGCGFAKRAAIRLGELSWSDNREIVFAGEGSHRHPLNDLISTMLPWFRGRYQMMKHEKQLREQPTSGTDAQTKGQSQAKANKYAAHVMDEDTDDEDDDDSTEDEDKTKFVKAASNLSGHRAMRLLLRKAVRTANWPSDDKLGDQLPQEYTSKR
ncbi:hypothetical protein A0H81_06301 [Grifola frondosa]|uniref:Fungal-type protein kinase domain-containing protein n=1 Tax=Grifola frondosa TaxID=5627 RepID=A0A1C7MAJ9_GRIFR|nr:hypothetical protein A0H81_06301 [Grifola frondosa]